MSPPREKTLWKRTAFPFFGTKTLDLTEILSKKFNEPKDLFTGGLIGNHYTDKGYNVVAEQTIKLINNSKKN